MWTLTLCIGIFLANCVQGRMFDFSDRASCERERAAQLHFVKDGWAVCAPKAPADPHH